MYDEMIVLFIPYDFPRVEIFEVADMLCDGLIVWSKGVKGK